MHDARVKFLLNLARKNPRFQFLVLAGAILIFLKSYFLGCSIRARKHFESSFPHFSLLPDILHMSAFNITAKILDILFSWLISLCKFEIESFISDELLKDSQNTDFGKFLKLSPEEHFTIFVIKRNAFTKFSVLILFSISQNFFSIFYESCQIIFCSKELRCYTLFSVLFLMVVYICTVYSAVSERAVLRRMYKE